MLGKSCKYWEGRVLQQQQHNATGGEFAHRLLLDLRTTASRHLNGVQLYKCELCWLQVAVAVSYCGRHADKATISGIQLDILTSSPLLCLLALLSGKSDTMRLRVAKLDPTLSGLPDSVGATLLRKSALNLIKTTFTAYLCDNHLFICT